MQNARKKTTEIHKTIQIWIHQILVQPECLSFIEKAYELKQTSHFYILRLFFICPSMLHPLSTKKEMNIVVSGRQVGRNVNMVAAMLCYNSPVTQFLGRIPLKFTLSFIDELSTNESLGCIQSTGRGGINYPSQLSLETGSNFTFQENSLHLTSEVSVIIVFKVAHIRQIFVPEIKKGSNATGSSRNTNTRCGSVTKPKSVLTAFPETIAQKSILVLEDVQSSISPSLVDQNFSVTVEELAEKLGIGFYVIHGYLDVIFDFKVKGVMPSEDCLATQSKNSILNPGAVGLRSDTPSIIITLSHSIIVQCEIFKIIWTGENMNPIDEARIVVEEYFSEF